MKIGDIVSPRAGHVLRCGSGSYHSAVVATLQPFGLISMDGDMRWTTTVKKEHVAVDADSKLPYSSAWNIADRIARDLCSGEDVHANSVALSEWMHILFEGDLIVTPDDMAALFLDRTRAEVLAREAFKDKFRRDGKTPAIRHMEAGVAHLKARMEADKVPMPTRLFRETIMWLHDYYEDIRDAKSLLFCGFREVVHYQVLYMSRDRSISYPDFIRKMLPHQEACYCKISDVCVNIAESPTDDQLIKYSQVLPWLVLACAR